MKFLRPFVLSAIPFAAVTQSPSTPPPAEPPIPKATEVMVIRATVKLYLDGTIRQWYSVAGA